MHGTGNALPTERATTNRPASLRRLVRFLACLLPGLFACDAAPALDLFTLWQRPELPLNLAAGAWADYRRQALTEGRRTEDLLRIQCLGRDDAGHWVLEVLPLAEPSRDEFVVVPGEGLRLSLSAAIEERSGGILAVVQDVYLWRDGEVRRLEREQWRQDPLVTASFSGDFRPDLVEERPATVRVIGDHELLCRQLVFAAADTQHAVSAIGEMMQISTQEVSAAVHPDLPLLGLAYVTERLRHETVIEPPGRRRPPPPQVRVEILECIGFGDDARPLLGPPPMPN
jgi:hypothetical protein